MVCCITEIFQKDVIDIQSGNRIGYVSDVEVETCSGQIATISVKQDNYFSIKQLPAIKINWCDISIIGNETVLVKNVCYPEQSKKTKKSLFGFLNK